LDRVLYAAVSFILILSGDLSSFSQQTSRAALPETEIRALADRILQKTGKRMGATLLRGTTENRGGPLRVQASLRSCVKDKAGPVEEFAFRDSSVESDLSPLEPFSKTLSTLDSSSIPLVRSAGADGISSPSCLYCPNPNYTDPARAAKFNGTVIMAVTVSPEGRTIEARVARGAP